MEALDVVDRVSLLLLDLGTVEKVNVAALDGSYANVVNKQGLYFGCPSAYLS